MLTRLFICVLLFASSFARAAEPRRPTDPPARVIAVDGANRQFPAGRAEKPTVITNEKELAAAFPDKETLARLTKEIDFTKEKFLFFAWSGSGQDQLTAGAEKVAGEIVFTLKRGRTRDLRSHVRLFAVEKEAKWKVVASF